MVRFRRTCVLESRMTWIEMSKQKEPGRKAEQCRLRRCATDTAKDYIGKAGWSITRHVDWVVLTSIADCIIRLLGVVT
jgi:hypothetical protein